MIQNKHLDDILYQLRLRGYTLRFRRGTIALYCNELEQWVAPDKFSIDESYYFEHAEAPDADRMLFAISMSKKKKGLLVDTCNVYMDSISPELRRKLNRTYPIVT